MHYHYYLVVIFVAVELSCDVAYPVFDYSRHTLMIWPAHQSGSSTSFFTDCHNDY